MNDKYLDTNSKFNESTFDKYELFNAVEEILYKNKIPCDDLKGNISVTNDYKMADWDEDRCNVKCTFNWIIYNNDIPKDTFKSLAKKIEKIFMKQFNITDENDIDCYRYRDSDYTSDGFDVELKLYISYKFEEEQE